MDTCHANQGDHGLLSQEQYHYTYHRVSTYDPNMCSAARFSPPYTNTQNDTSHPHTGYENVILVPNNGSVETVQNIENNSIITENDGGQTYIVSPETRPYTDTDYERSNIVEDNHAVFDEHRVHHVAVQECENVSNLQLMTSHQQPQHLSDASYEISDHHHQLPVKSEIVIHRSPNGHLYQNFYVGHDIKESALVELVHIQNHVDVCQQQYIACKTGNIPPVEYPTYQTKLQNNNALIENLPDNGFIHLESSIIAHQTQEEYLQESYTMNSNQQTSLSLHDKEQQRILLESTMSPLLAAVNDITQRDAELQSYLNQNVEKENNLDIFKDICATRRSNDRQYNVFQEQKDEFVAIDDIGQINDMGTRESGRDVKEEFTGDDDYLLVSDKTIESRARASLPTNYLYFGKSEILNEPLVFAKKEIPLRTKFGPFEGEIRLINDAVLDVLKFQTARTYPLLILDQTRILEVANENSSNWMRFVRMAIAYNEQNVLLYEESGKLFFKCCQLIKPKEELRVGYSKEYAEYHGLTFLAPILHENCEMYGNGDICECIDCSRQFGTAEEIQKDLNTYETSDNPSDKVEKEKIVRKRKKQSTPMKLRKRSNRCSYCFKVFMTSSSLKKHMEIHESSKNSKDMSIKDNTFRCSVCYKKFTSDVKLKSHRLTHIKNELKPFECSLCTRRCSTAAALTAHIRSHTNRYFNCVFCPETFKHVLDFKKHVHTHSSNGIFSCQYCKKKYGEYYLVRKHIKIFHPSVKFSCNECGRQFLNMNFLRRHKVCHSEKRDFLCSQCGKQFKRKDKLREHIQRMHSENKKPKTRRKQLAKSIVQNLPSYLHLSPMKKDKKFDNQSNDEDLLDYQRFIYKCDNCLLGFKRRGMLVNHMAKRHPNISLETIPELNLPILKPQSLFYCQYCSKVYKSNAKRKLHIIKNHPGEQLPPSLKGNPEAAQTFSRTIGNLRTEPQRCQWCYKQYASRNRLLVHYRKQHPNMKEIIENDNQNSYVYNEPIEIYSQPPNSPENKLLKLSSAALELSSIEDRKFFDFLNEKSNNSLNEQNPIVESNSKLDLNNANDNANGFSKVDVNFKVEESEFTETSSNGELNRLPQLFEESMACI